MLTCEQKLRISAERWTSIETQSDSVALHLIELLLTQWFNMVQLLSGPEFCAVSAVEAGVSAVPLGTQHHPTFFSLLPYSSVVAALKGQWRWNL